MKYSAIILDHFHNPRNVGSFPADEPFVYTAKAGDYSRGDIIQLQLKCEDRHVILQTRFKAYGSVATIAIGSFLCEWLENKSLEEAKSQLNCQYLMDALELPNVKVYCALLAEDVLNNAVAKILTLEDMFLPPQGEG